MKTFKFRLFPNKNHRKKLNATLEECRWLYNHILQTRRDAYEYDGSTLGLYDINPMIPKWKEDRPSLKRVHSQTLQNVSERVQVSFQNFWRRCKSGEKPGYPRFKSEDRYDSFTFMQDRRGFKFLDNKTLKIHNVGNIRIKKHRPIDGKIKRLTVHRDGAGCWFACFSVEADSKPLPKNDDAIGIDVGLESFATLSDGEIIDNPRFLRRDQKRLKKIQRQLSKSPRSSERRAKKKRALGKVWRRVSNRRKDFAHKFSRRLVNRYGIICVEDLKIQRMMSGNFRSMNRSIGDAAWSQFLQFTSYKAEDAGRMFIEVNPRNTSQICSECGEMVKKELCDRIHHCPICRFETSRDHNAALNILRRGLSSLAKVV